MEGYEKKGEMKWEMRKREDLIERDWSWGEKR